MSVPASPAAENLALTGFELQTVQLVKSKNTVCATTLFLLMYIQVPINPRSNNQVIFIV
jgi:hypothetical protein